MKRFFALALVLGLAAPAGADPTDDPAGHTAGVQPVPPIAPATRGPLRQIADERRAVRGCAVGEPCARHGEEVRAIDVELFGSRDGDPWVDREHAPAVSATPPAGAKPTDLHPELPWLADLQLPDLPIRWDDRLIKYLVFYKEDPRGRAIMRGWLTDQGKYKDMILGYLRKAHLPEDLLYVAMIESGYNPLDDSYAGASGLWQFMPEGGRIYGLAEDHWLDERNDPVRATEAQMDYFGDLYQRFGDWHLALAAFNAGFGAVLTSVARYNTNDFWQLASYENALPWETSLYVPKALACAIVGHNKALFGYGDLQPAPAESWDEVSVPTSISIAVIAQASGTTANAIARLNPQLRRGRTPPGRSYVVRVPAGGGAKFEARLGELKSQWDGYDAYVVAHGERFEDIALVYGMTSARLRALNGLTAEAEVAGGMTLLVPRVSEADRQRNLDRALENLYASGIDTRKGEPLIVPVPDKDADVPDRVRVFYRAVAGDTVRGVSRALGVTAEDLVAWNGIDASGRLHPKMIVQAWVAKDWDAKRAKVKLLDERRIMLVTRGSLEHLDLAANRMGRVRLEYTAKRRESFESIGSKFGLGKRDLARINRMPSDTVLEKGQSIIVYQAVDRSRSKRADLQWRKAPAGGRGHVKVPGTSPATGTASAGDRISNDDADAGKAADDDADGASDDADASGDETPDARSDAKAAAKADGKSDAKSDGKPDAKRDAKPAAKADGKADGKRDAKPAAKADGKSDAKPAAKAPTGRHRTSARDDDDAHDDAGPVARPGDVEH
ncbi:MAG: transglycosylase SLT domain-containing protein [Deltaproteobacteria bacterium]|nr:transglycosylase SLT domain-containing protein [Deltaproteobacteria bacterium]